MKVIKNTTSGNPSLDAYLMAIDGYVAHEWAMKVIENTTTGNPSSVARLMVNCGHATKEWYKEIKRKNDVSR